MDPTKDVLNAQRQFWDSNFAAKPEMFAYMEIRFNTDKKQRS